MIQLRKTREKKGREITSYFRILLSMSVTCCFSIVSSLEERHFNHESDSPESSTLLLFMCKYMSLYLILQIVMSKYFSFTKEVTASGSEPQMCNANLFYMPRVFVCLNQKTMD